MYQFFLVCFLVGVILTVVSFILGHLFEIFGIDGLDFDLHFFGIDLFLPMSPLVYLLFLVVFGGMGMILINMHMGLSILFISIVSFLIAALIAYFVYHFIIKPLKKAQNTSAADKEELIGIRAAVSETIPANSYGEIKYLIHGNSYVAPAKATTEVEIKAGSNVVICWIKDYVFYVASIDI
ncbi:hypothetical protein [Anaeromicropila herbilytica]|uniref:Membrane protein NfeD2 N-terminal transmembrane domain-containing protein n=1 Tax=Anaeromicropila herbilytica TaxID=2785025 RepID=A0A7R7EP25_9FIRM|nr:hypothetical protein [Anaeromicropila herbilytica]BCN32161.1 hypothetical protein bsdtb5_34560 [Anaeromicropila herbilytica]